MNKEELINKLPVEWSEITLNQYINLINMLPDIDSGDERYNTKFLSAWFKNFTGVDIIDADLRATEMISITHKINSFNESPNTGNIDVTDKIKAIDEITFEEFITLTKLLESATYNTYPTMINMMLKEPIDNIGDVMDMATANSFFLLLKEQLIIYLNRSQTCLKQRILNLMKLKMQ